MLYTYKGFTPQPSPDAFVAPGAQLIGKVVLGKGASVWYNAVLRGDSDTITVGNGSNIQDNSVVHCDAGFPVVIGERVTVGHGCIIHGCEIGDDTLVGMGTTILNGAKIGPNSLIGAGSLITEGKEFPSGSVIMGRPAQVVRQVGERELAMIHGGAAHYQRNARDHKQATPSA